MTLSSSIHSTDDWEDGDFDNRPAAFGVSRTNIYASMLQEWQGQGDDTKLPQSIRIVWTDRQQTTFQMWDIGGIV